jgi:hypothetical protein
VRPGGERDDQVLGLSQAGHVLPGTNEIGAPGKRREAQEPPAMQTLTALAVVAFSIALPVLFLVQLAVL